jgi:hypothetical protein
MDFGQLASQESIDRAIAALKANGIEAEFAVTGAKAKEKVLAMIPANAEIMTMTSMTLETLDLTAEINESGKYNSVRQKLNSMDRATQGSEMQKLGAAPEWTVGSVHAVTEDGQALIASNTGSQLPAYAYGASHVIWVVGAQKIVKDLDMAMKRIYQHSLPLESERAKKAYGTAGSNVSKILIMNKEVAPGRLHMVIVNEVLGF